VSTCDRMTKWQHLTKWSPGSTEPHELPVSTPRRRRCCCVAPWNDRVRLIRQVEPASSKLRLTCKYIGLSTAIGVQKHGNSLTSYSATRCLLYVYFWLHGALFVQKKCRFGVTVRVTRSTQPCVPSGSLNRVPASAGVRAGMSPLSGGR